MYYVGYSEKSAYQSSASRFKKMGVTGIWSQEMQKYYKKKGNEVWTYELK